MNAILFKQSALLLFFAAFAVLAGGCGQQTPGSTPIADTSHEDHSHGGWWCVEHGVPEEECSMCSSTAAAEFKADGDWCEEHNRAESQCFICDPSRAEKFANLYEAKVGKAPPKYEDEG